MQRVFSTQPRHNLHESLLSQQQDDKALGNVFIKGQAEPMITGTRQVLSKTRTVLEKRAYNNDLSQVDVKYHYGYQLDS